MRGRRMEISEIILLLFSVLHLLIGTLVLGLGAVGREYRRFSIGTSLFCFALGVAVLIYAVSKNKRAGALSTQKRHRTEYILTAALFLVQVFVSYNTYFYTGWDCCIVLSASENIANGWDFAGSYSYFSEYPNNLFITHVFGFIKYYVKEIGLEEKSYGMVMLIFFQCFLNALTGLLLFRLLTVWKNRKTAWEGYVFYLILVGTSPWFLIPYSDATGLVFPVLLLYLWMRQQKAEGWKKFLWWGLLGLGTAVGYHVKPQAAILSIAVLLLSGIGLLKKQTLKKRAAEAAGLGLALLCFGLLFRGMEERYYYAYEDIDKEGALGLSHFLMMGLNPETNGTHSSADVDFSISFPTKQERRQQNLRVAGERLKGLGASGLVRHFANKLIINYEDGSFGWPDGDEWYFYQVIPEEKIPYVSALLRDMLYGHGIFNTCFLYLKQGAWLLILLLMVLGVLTFRKEKYAAVPCLSLIGLFLFCSLFEAGGRYQYTYAPVYCVLAAVSLEGLHDLTFREKGGRHAV